HRRCRPSLLPRAVPDRRRQDGQIRGLERRGRAGHELLRRERHARGQVGQAVHHARQLLPWRIRRLVLESPVPDLRMRPDLGRPDPLFQFHHPPLAYFANCADGTPGRAQHLRDELDFYNDVADGKLPAVSFIKSLGPNTEHPGYAPLLAGQQHATDLVNTIINSSAWNDTAIIITYDEHGGRWDHVPPPAIDRWGPGQRVPAIVISPIAKKAFVDQTQYE